jgi:hypothetical protein
MSRLRDLARKLLTTPSTPDGEHTIVGGLDTIAKRFDLEPLPTGTAPVFVLASAWRSGSTLLQRMLVSTGELLMWGEPYDHSALIRRLADSVAPFDGKWPPDPYIVDPADPPTPDKWIANAYPAPHHLMAAHRAFFDTLFTEPAREAGFERWGLKAVRLDGEHARYLQYLYPDARFVFLHRNPYDAFLSYRLLHDIRPHSYWWYHRWPDIQVSTAEHFGAIWASVTESFLDNIAEVNGDVVAYEDVMRGDLTTFERATGLTIDPSVLEDRVGATADQKGVWKEANRSLSDEERASIEVAAGAVARRLGYVGPTDG